MVLNGSGVSIWDDENFPEAVMVVQHGEQKLVTQDGMLGVARVEYFLPGTVYLGEDNA